MKSIGNCKKIINVGTVIKMYTQVGFCVKCWFLWKENKLNETNSDILPHYDKTP